MQDRPSRKDKDTHFYSTVEFKKLDAEWKKKLVDSGFDDAEQDDDHMKEWALFLSAPSKYCETTYKAKEDYYRLAGQFLHDYKFQSAFDRKVWKYHTEGVPIRRIVSLIKKTGVYTYKRKVDETIRRLAHEMTMKLK